MARKRYVQNSSGQMWLAVVIIVLAIFSGMYFFSAGNTGSTVKTTEKLITQSSLSDFCSNNPNLDLNTRIRDILSTSGAYINGSTVYLEDAQSGYITTFTADGGTTGNFDTQADVLKCGDQFRDAKDSDVIYRLYIKGTGSYTSDGIYEITKSDLYQTPVQVSFDSTLYSPMKVKARDNDANADAYSSTNSTDYQTGLTSTFYSGTGSTDWTIGTDGFLDLGFKLEANTSSRTKGSAMYIAVNIADDSNIDDWDEDSVIIKYNGVQLSEATGISANEIKALSSYEKIYKVEDAVGIRGTSKQTVATLDFYVASGSGINPDFDPVIKVVALGDVQSVEDPTKMLHAVGFDDSTSRTELYSAQTITLSVS